MTTAVIGASGTRRQRDRPRPTRARGCGRRARSRPHRGRRAFGEPDGPHIRLTRVDDPRDLTEAFDGIRTLFIAMGSIAIEGVLQRIAINVASGSSSIGAGHPPIGAQTSRRTRLGSTSEPTTGSTTSPPRPQCRTRRSAPRSSRRRGSPRRTRCAPRRHGPAGLAGNGRMALIDHRDAAEAELRVLTDPALWGAHHDLTGPDPMSCEGASPSPVPRTKHRRVLQNAAYRGSVRLPVDRSLSVRSGTPCPYATKSTRAAWRFRFRRRTEAPLRPDAWHPVHRHDVGVCDLAMVGARAPSLSQRGTWSSEICRHPDTPEAKRAAHQTGPCSATGSIEWGASGRSESLPRLPSGSRIAHAGLPFANPMSGAVVDATLAPLPLPARPGILDTGCGSGEMLLRVLRLHRGRADSASTSTTTRSPTRGSAPAICPPSSRSATRRRSRAPSTRSSTSARRTFAAASPRRLRRCGAWRR